MEISFVGVILLDFLQALQRAPNPASTPSLLFFVSAVMGELLQQFGNVNTGVQGGIIFLSGLIVWDCVFFSFCFALVTRESRRSNKTPQKMV